MLDAVGGVAGAVGVLAALAVFYVWPLIVCFLKGKPWFGLLGLVGLWPFTWAGAIRLGKPNSTFAQRRYDDDQMREAMHRFPREASLIRGVDLSAYEARR